VLVSLILFLAAQTAVPAFRSRPVIVALRWATADSARTAASVILLCVLVSVIALGTTHLIQAVRPAVSVATVSTTVADQISRNVAAVSMFAPWRALGLAMALLLVSVLVSRPVNINIISPIALARSRLVSTYLASVHSPGLSDIPLPSLVQSATNNSLSGRPAAPLLIVNMAREALGSERHLEPWTASPLHVGGSDMGFRPSVMADGGPLTVGTAMAISAATRASKRPRLRAIVAAVLNQRSGWWYDLDNGTHGDSSKVTTLLRPLYPWVADFLSLRDEGHHWARLTGGQHYESLAMFEMVRRRCGVIVVVDTSEDPSYFFEQLSATIRRIRIDLGARIDFPNAPVAGRGRYCVVGRVIYSETDDAASDGALVYIKPVVNGDEPREIVSYASTHSSFPQEQVRPGEFDESEFESYRALGAYPIDAIAGTSEEPFSLKAFVDSAQRCAAPAEKGVMAAVADASVQRLEQEVQKLVDLIAVPVLENYQGVLCADVRAGDLGMESQSGSLLLEVRLQPRPPESGTYERVTIRNGTESSEVRFDVSVKGIGIEFLSPPTQRVQVNAREGSAAVHFWFRQTGTLEAPHVIVQLFQKNRLVQVLQVSAGPFPRKSSSQERV